MKIASIPFVSSQLGQSHARIIGSAASRDYPRRSEESWRGRILGLVLAWGGAPLSRSDGKRPVFMVAILTTYFFGLAIGRGNVVYASFRSDDWRLQYVCQVGVGLPALPALVQTFRVSQRQQPIPMFGNSRFMAPPSQVRGGGGDELSEWHKRPGMSFEMGTVYTMVAGLLNILAICDAYAGPLLMSSDEKKKRAREKAKLEVKSPSAKESAPAKSPS